MKQNNNNNNGYLYSLDLLRFLGALHIVAFHYLREEPWVQQHVPIMVQQFIGNGYTTVGLFFILSGFVLTYNYHGHHYGRSSQKQHLSDPNEQHSNINTTTESSTRIIVAPPPHGEKRKTFNALHFYAARLSRLYPMFFLTLCAAILLNYLTGEWERNHRPWTQYLFVFSCTHAFHRKYIFDDFFNGPSWSVSAELFFYLVFPLVLKASHAWSLTSTVPTSPKRSESSALNWLRRCIFVALARKVLVLLSPPSPQRQWNQANDESDYNLSPIVSRSDEGPIPPPPPQQHITSQQQRQQLYSSSPTPLVFQQVAAVSASGSEEVLQLAALIEKLFLLVITWVTSILIAVGFNLSDGHNSTLKFLPPLRLPQFLFGCLLGFIFTSYHTRRLLLSRGRRNSSVAFNTLTVALLVCSGALCLRLCLAKSFAASPMYPYFVLGLLDPLHGAIIFLLACMDGPLSASDNNNNNNNSTGGGGDSINNNHSSSLSMALFRLVSRSRAVNCLGRASYCIYILQSITNRVFWAVVIALKGANSSIAPVTRLLLTFAYIGLLLVTALLSHRWIEISVAQWLLSRLLRSAPATPKQSPQGQEVLPTTQKLSPRLSSPRCRHTLFA